MASVSGKKLKRVSLTIEEKLNACEMVRNKVTKLMEKFNIGESTLNSLCRKEESLKKTLSSRKKM